MRGPPDPEMRRGAGQGTPRSQSSSQQQPYTIRADVQVFIAALLPLSFPLLCLFVSWGASR
jgi:hypothetical protein